MLIHTMDSPWLRIFDETWWKNRRLFSCLVCMFSRCLFTSNRVKRYIGKNKYQWHQIAFHQQAAALDTEAGHGVGKSSGRTSVSTDLLVDIWICHQMIPKNGWHFEVSVSWHAKSVQVCHHAICICCTQKTKPQGYLVVIHIYIYGMCHISSAR